MLKCEGLGIQTFDAFDADFKWLRNKIRVRVSKLKPDTPHSTVDTY